VFALQWNPRVKPEHGLHRTPDGKVRVGGSVYGIAAEVEDASGAVWTMLTAADGTRSTDEIVRHVLDAHPGAEAANVLAALEQFADSGYLDNAGAESPSALSPREQERHSRSRRFFRWIDLQRRDDSWEPQIRLKSARVVIVGMGGTGGTAALALGASGVGRLHCVDGDVVELSNLNRQVQFDESDLGRPKAGVTAARLRRLNSDITVTDARTMVTDEADLDELVRDCDVFVLCADQPGQIRAWANRACLRAGTPWVDAGYHGPNVNATAYVPGDGPCYECVWLREHEQHRAVAPGRPYDVDRSGLSAVNAVSAGLSGHLAAHLTIALITGIPAIAPGQPLTVNLAVHGSHELPPFPRHPRCPACGTDR
jgi:molybdopterin/thiamine biosynthesis adenylyltransferase